MAAVIIDRSITRVTLVTVNEAVKFTVTDKNMARITVLLETNAGRFGEEGTEGAVLPSDRYAPVDADRYFTFWFGRDNDNNVFFVEPLTGNTVAVIIIEPTGS